jgi:L-alanine-DL-glutamate epimerase-like enolase superfamily enzyme
MRHAAHFRMSTRGLSTISHLHGHAETEATRIVEAETRLVRIPVTPPRGDAIQKFTTLELPIVRLTDAAGRTGLGFGYTIGTGGRAIVALLEDELLPLLTARDSRAIAALTDELTRSIHALTPGCLTSTAVAAIDVALWDLAGHRTGTPLWLLLGGARDRVPVYNTDVGWLDRPLDEVVALSVEAVRHGFRALKLKVGKPDPHEDRERVARVRDAVGPRVALMIDANQAWSIDEAIRRLGLLEAFELAWIEEPLPATDVEGYATLGRHTHIPRAGGESLYSPAAFADYVRRGALDILQPDIARVGGLTNALRVCHLALTAGLRVAPHISPELSVSLAAAVPNSMFIEYIPHLEPTLRHPVQLENGFAIPPDEPGHGIDFDPAALARFDATPRGR